MSSYSFIINCNIKNKFDGQASALMDNGNLRCPSRRVKTNSKSQEPILKLRLEEKTIQIKEWREVEGPYLLQPSDRQ